MKQIGASRKVQGGREKMDNDERERERALSVCLSVCLGQITWLAGLELFFVSFFVFVVFFGRLSQCRQGDQ